MCSRRLRPAGLSGTGSRKPGRAIRNRPRDGAWAGACWKGKSTPGDQLVRYFAGSERGDDVLRLAEHFLMTLRPDCSPVRGFSPEVIALFREYNWPGNVRELRNAVERGHALCQGTAIVPEDLPPAIRERIPPSATSNESRAEALLEAEKRYLIGLLKEQKGNIAGCSGAAKVSRQCLHGLLVKHQLDPAQFR